MHTSSVTTPAQTPSLKNPEQIRKVAQEFESIFTSMMLKAMRGTVGENPLMPSSFGEKVYSDMLDSEYAAMIGKSSTLGLSNLIIKELERQSGNNQQIEKLQLKGIQPWMLDTRMLPSGTKNTPKLNPAIQLSNVKKWESLIEQASAAHNVDKTLIAAVIAQESGGNQYAVSKAGAKGLMQLMDSTASDLGVTSPFVAADNIRGGTQYLAKLLNQFDGNERLALASYNAGPAAVKKYGGIPPYRETQQYVDSVLNMRSSFATLWNKTGE